MPDWKRIKIDFPTVKLGQFIEPLKKTYVEIKNTEYSTVFGVSNTAGITITGKESSKDISKYIILENNCFAYNPYRINVGSIGMNYNGLKGCVSPAYVVFKTKENLNPFFLNFYLKSNYGNHLINWYGNRGGVRNALRFDDLSEIDIPDIDLNTQKNLLIKLDLYKEQLNIFNYECKNQSSYFALLRQSILQEAIEGKLTADWRVSTALNLRKVGKEWKGDPEYDAQALLDKIKTEKQKLIVEGKIRKDKPFEPIKAEEVPFKLPEGWVWCRLWEITKNSEAGKSFLCIERKIEDNEWGVVKVSSVSWGCFLENENKYYQEKKPNDIRFQIKQGDFLISRANTKELIGKWVIVRAISKNLLLSDKIIRFHFFLEPLKEFIAKLNDIKYIRDYFAECGTGSSPSMKNITRDHMNQLILPLPPLSEQKAIIEKVEKLLSIVDELERLVSERKEQAEELMQAVLREAFEG